MTTKSDKLNIYQRIAAVMADVGYVLKDGKVDMGRSGGYKYASHDAVCAAVRPSMIKHGIVMLSSVVNVGVNSNRTELTVDTTFVNIDEPADRHTVTTVGFGIDPQDKGPGKAMSYATKYAILKTFMLETGDDPERDSIDHEPAPATADPTPAEIVDDANAREAQVIAGHRTASAAAVKRMGYDVALMSDVIKRACDRVRTEDGLPILNAIYRFADLSIDAAQDIRNDVCEMAATFEDICNVLIVTHVELDAAAINQMARASIAALALAADVDNGNPLLATPAKWREWWGIIKGDTEGGA